MPRTKVDDDAQLRMDERTIVDGDIEQALEARQAAKDEMGEYRLAYKNADAHAKSMIERLELPDPEIEEEPQVVRVGRFRITKKLVKGRAVSFETEDRVQLTIGLADEDEEAPARDGTEDQDAVNRLAELGLTVTSEDGEPAQIRAVDARPN